MKIETKEILESLERFQRLNLSSDRIDKSGEMITIRGDKLYGVCGSCLGKINLNLDIQVNQTLRFKELYELVSKIKTKEVDISQKNGNMCITTKRMQVELNSLPDIENDLDTMKGKWIKLPEDFLEGLQLCVPSAMSENSRVLSNLKITKKHLYSCDNVRLSRHTWKKPMDVKDTLIPAVGANRLIKFSPTKMSVHEKALLFTNKYKDILAIRQTHSMKEFPDLDKVLKVLKKKGVGKVQLPLSLKNSLSRLSIFGDNEVTGDNIVNITIKGNLLVCQAESLVGKIKETIEANSDNRKQIDFIINPMALVEILDREDKEDYINASIGDNYLIFRGKRFEYFVVCKVK